MTALYSALSLYLHGPQPKTSGLPLYLLNIGPDSGIFNLFTKGYISSSSGLSLYTNGHINLNGSISLYIPVESDVHSNIPLYVNNLDYIPGTGIERKLKLFVYSETGETAGALSFAGSMTLYISRYSESVEGGLPLFVKSIGGMPNSYLTLYTSGNFDINNNINLYLQNNQGSGYNYLQLYTHGF